MVLAHCAQRAADAADHIVNRIKGMEVCNY
jgi:hypothetical protein